VKIAVVRIAALSIGSRGDVQPFVALAQGLRRAGHDAWIVAFPEFRALVESAGQRLVPLKTPDDTLTGEADARALRESSDSLIRHMRVIRSISQRLVTTPGYWESLEAACSGADALIYHYTAPQGYHLAEKLGIPAIAAAAAPTLAPTRTFPHPLWPPDARGIPVRWTHLVCEQFMWQPFRTMLNDWRRNILGLKPERFFGPYSRIRRGLLLYGYSPALLPPAPDWREQVRVTGFWFRDSPQWKPASHLETFLAAGPPPVFFGFGSHGTGDVNSTLPIIREALRKAGKRGIVAVSANTPLDASDDLFPVRDVPHEHLFPRMSAVVHHCGAGTTGTVLRAGVPQVFVPHFSDQPFWANRLHQAGLGPAPIPAKLLNAERLASALAQVDSMRARAEELGCRVRAENGVAVAVSAIEKHIQNFA
jgi:sterol 3beta-glucosyltransferase